MNTEQVRGSSPQMEFEEVSPLSPEWRSVRRCGPKFWSHTSILHVLEGGRATGDRLYNEEATKDSIKSSYSESFTTFC